MSYQIYFDFMQSKMNWFNLWPGALLILITIIWFLVSKKTRGRIYFISFFLAFQIAILSFFIFISYNQFAYYSDKFKKNEYSIVEGIVTNHEPVTYGDGGRESFEVNGIQFAFLGKDPPPVFNQTVAKGGKIRNGLQVKIYYTSRYGAVPRWAILRIEIKK